MFLCYVVKNILTLIPKWDFDKSRLYDMLRLVLVWYGHELVAPLDLD